MSKAESTLAFSSKQENINILWANMVIEELTRFAIKDFCIAPGSRSTPLTLAVANHPKTSAHVHFDERGLGFLALGLSKSSGKPVVIITTSGTAVANLYPAVIEAKQSNVPLIVLSADRPAELIDCSANQAINQHKIFADYPVYFAQLPTPSSSVQAGFVLTTIDQGLAAQAHNHGPIHLNMAFAEPFYPDGSLNDFSDYLKPIQYWRNSQQLFTEHTAVNQQINHKQIEINSAKILVIVGRMQDTKQIQVISDFCENNKLVMLADIQSQLQNHPLNLSGYDLLLENPQFKQQLLASELIIQFSDHLVSKRLNQMLAENNALHWVISESKQRIDPNHSVNQRFYLTAEQFCKRVTNSQEVDVSWTQNLIKISRQLNEVIKLNIPSMQLNEINCTQYMLQQPEQQLLIGNSLPIRIADMFANTQAEVFTNRGASGIDGLLATTVGIAKANNKVTSLLIGDTSFLYDLNSLSLISQLTSTLVIVVINNDGGGIFNMLPVPAQAQQTFYQLPHGLTFEKSCQQFDIEYFQPNSLDEFQSQFDKALNNHANRATLIEVCVNNQLTPSLIKQVKSEVKNAIIL